MDWNWLLSIIVSAIVSGIVGYAVKRSFDNYFLKKKEQEESKKEQMDRIENKLTSNSEGTVTLLRDRMKCLKDEYEERGYAKDGDKANWKELYDSYKNLGGNHFREYVDQWKVTIEKLPKVPPQNNQ